MAIKNVAVMGGENAEATTVEKIQFPERNYVKGKLHRLRMLPCFFMVNLILFSCADEPTKTERTPTSTFPLTTDSRWVYEGIIHDVPFNDSTLAETSSVEVSRHIIGKDSLGQIADLVVCDDTIITAGPMNGEIDTLIQRQWLKLEDNKLKLFAFDDFAAGDTAEPVLFDFPHNLLNFPLNGGKAWVVYSDAATRENRAVVGVDYIELPYGWQYCEVIRGRIVDIDTEDTLLTSYEWFSDNGLMRLEYDHGTRMITDNGTLLDSARTYEIWDLMGIEIQP